MRANEFINEVNINPKDQWFGPGQIGGRAAGGSIGKISPKNPPLSPSELPPRINPNSPVPKDLPRINPRAPDPTDLPRVTNPGNPPLTSKELGKQVPKYTQSELGTFKRTPDGKIIDPQGQVVNPRTGDPYTKADVTRDTGKSPEFKSLSPERSHYARTTQADRVRDEHAARNMERYADEYQAARARWQEKGDAASFGDMMKILNRVD